MQTYHRVQNRQSSHSNGRTKFHYRCADCGRNFRLHRAVSTSRCSREHCRDCGSTFLKPVNGASQDAAMGVRIPQ